MKNVYAYILTYSVCASLTQFIISNYLHTAYSNDKLKINVKYHKTAV